MAKAIPEDARTVRIAANEPASSRRERSALMRVSSKT
jgi:hypothetical protein